MLVSDHMTVDPICITKDMMVSKALDLMTKNNFHRLPVVDAEHHLIGLVTAGLIAESSGTKTTSLSIYELNYLLNRTRVEDIMITDVRTATPDAIVDEAAAIMRQNNVSVLPVVDGENKVIGIITEMDLFDSLIGLMGYQVTGTHFIINVPHDVPGVIAGITQLLYQNNININNFLVYRGTRGVELYVVTMEKCEPMAAAIEGMGLGYKVHIVR